VKVLQKKVKLRTRRRKITIITIFFSTGLTNLITVGFQTVNTRIAQILDGILEFCMLALGTAASNPVCTVVGASVCITSDVSKASHTITTTREGDSGTAPSSQSP